MLDICILPLTFQVFQEEWTGYTSAACMPNTAPPRATDPLKSSSTAPIVVPPSPFDPVATRTPSTIPAMPSVMKDLNNSPPSPITIAIAIGLLGVLAGYFVGQGRSIGLFGGSGGGDAGADKRRKRGKGKKSWPNSYDVKVHEDSSSEDVAGVGTGETESEDEEEEEDLDDSENMQEVKTFEGNREEVKLVLCLRTDLGMTKGKMVAQASHATLACYKYLSATPSTASLLKRWENGGQAKVALQVKSEDELLTLQAQAVSLGLCARKIQDAGRTQIAAGSTTVLGILGPKSEVDKVTGGLKLL